MSLARFSIVLVAASISGCMSVPLHQPIDGAFLTSVQPFSVVEPGVSVTKAWQPYILSHLKRRTEYRAVAQDGVIVMKAVADSSASGLSQQLKLDCRDTPYLTWKWNVSHILAEANNAFGPDDAPARVIVAFEGDKSKWNFEDQAFADRIMALTGNVIPYATLMYIWSNGDPEGSIIENRHTSRIKMVVAETGPGKLGEWVNEKRNLYEDYKRAFGEEPGKVISIGIMSDTDNTGQKVTTYYGDIAFTRRAN